MTLLSPPLSLNRYWENKCFIQEKNSGATLTDSKLEQHTVVNQRSYASPNPSSTNKLRKKPIHIRNWVVSINTFNEHIKSISRASPFVPYKSISRIDVKDLIKKSKERLRKSELE